MLNIFTENRAAHLAERGHLVHENPLRIVTPSVLK